MADTDIQTHRNDAGEKAASAARKTAVAATEAGAEVAQSAIDAERRSFAAGSQTAETVGRAARASAQAGQQAMQRAGDQAAELWRGSFNPLAHLQGEFGRWFEHMWRQSSPSRLQNASPFTLALAPFIGQPLADLHETDEAVELRVELPGLKAEDVQLSLQGDALTVSGEKADEIERDKGGYRFSERRFGRFERTFMLPPDADRGRIDASFSDGLLKIVIAKTPGGAEAKTIPIKG